MWNNKYNKNNDRSYYIETTAKMLAYEKKNSRIQLVVISMNAVKIFVFVFFFFLRWKLSKCGLLWYAWKTKITLQPIAGDVSLGGVI